jgi:hypothetical protein
MYLWVSYKKIFLKKGVGSGSISQRYGSGYVPKCHGSPNTADSVWLWLVGGGWVLKCVVDHILQEFNTVTEQVQNLQNCYTTRTKMTNKDDISGLVSLNFKVLRPSL